MICDRSREDVEYKVVVVVAAEKIKTARSFSDATNGEAGTYSIFVFFSSNRSAWLIISDLFQAEKKFVCALCCVAK